MSTAEEATVGAIDTGTVVVGVDGSEHCRLAVKWAADEARRRSAPLLVLYAQLHEPEQAPGWYKPGESVGTAGQAVVDDAVGLAVTRHPSMPVQGRAVEWPATIALIGASRSAGLLVVGARGMGGFKELLLGSVSDQCIQYAHCPVVVVHGDAEDPRFDTPAPRIVVGIDGSPGSDRALQWALQEAEVREASVEAVFARHVPAWLPATTDAATRAHAEAADAVVAAATAQSAEWAPGVTITGRAVDRQAVPALLEAAQGGDLLVVGSDGHRGFHRALLGSVAHQVARHGPCPVAVVRPHTFEEDSESAANLWTGTTAGSSGPAAPAGRRP